IEHNRWDDETKLRKISACLKGTAEAWFKRKQFRNYRQFHDEFIKYFSSDELHIQQLRAMLNRRKYMENEPVSEYLGDIENLARKCFEECSDRTIIEHVKQGLPSRFIE